MGMGLTGTNNNDIRRPPLKVTITLHDDCARTILRETARRYAVLCVKSRMPADIVNAPWGGRMDRAGGRKSWTTVYREWMADIDRQRADYKKSLQSVVADLPPVPEIELKPYVSPRENRTYAGVYPSSQAEKVARDYAEAILAAA